MCGATDIIGELYYSFLEKREARNGRCCEEVRGCLARLEEKRLSLEGEERPEGRRALLDEYDELWERLVGGADKDGFVRGFRLGALLMLSVTAERDGDDI